MYVALGVNLDGRKELLGLWLGENEGAKFWLGVMTDMKNRGLRDIFVACIDGLSGFAEAIHAAYPQTKVQLCIVHLVRAALRYPNEESAVKLVFMAIREASKKWTMPIHHWKEALNHFAIMFEDRMPMSLSKLLVSERYSNNTNWL